MMSVRWIYVLSIMAAIVAAFTSFLPNAVKALLFLVAIIMDVFVNKDMALKSRPLKLLLVFYFVSFIYVFILERGHFSEIRNILLPYPMMLMCFWIAPGLLKLNVKEAKLIWYAFLFCLTENLIVTAFIGQADPMIIRYAFSGYQDNADNSIIDVYSRMGLLSYNSAHLLSLLSTFFIVVVLENKKLWRRILMLLVAFLAVYVMYLTTITTALLLGVICMVAVVLLYNTKGNMKLFVILFSVLAIILFTTGSLVAILQSGSQGGNSELSVKLNDVAESIVTGKGQGQVNGREEVLNMTLDAIEKNPILGGADGPTDTGQHSLFLDYWAYYGVFSLFLFVGWWKEVKRIRIILDIRKRGLYYICLLPIIGLCILKGPFFLPDYIFATIVILRVGYMSLDIEFSQSIYVKRKR